MNSAVTALEVQQWLGAHGQDSHMETCAAAVTAYVSTLPHIDLDENGDWAAQTKLGALMLAARLYKRRNSPNGIESFAEVGNTYVSRYDSDIARLLHIEAFKKPKVG